MGRDEKVRIVLLLLFCIKITAFKLRRWLMENFLSRWFFKFNLICCVLKSDYLSGLELQMNSNQWSKSEPCMFRQCSFSWCLWNVCDFEKLFGKFYRIFREILQERILQRKISYWTKLIWNLYFCIRML